MNRIGLSVFTIALAVATGVPVRAQRAGAAAKAAPSAIDSVIQSVKAGLSESLIIRTLQRENKPAKLTQADLVTLKNAGVSENIIGVMLDPTSAPAPTVPPAPAPPPQPAGDTQQQPLKTAQRSDFLYKFGGVDYEFLIVPMPNGKANGMVFRLDKGTKQIVGLITQDQISGASGNKSPQEIIDAYNAYKSGVPSGADGPSATVAETTTSPQSQNVTAVGGGTSSQVVWDAAAHTVTANGVQFSSDGKHLRMVSGSYADIGAEYENGAGKRSLSVLRAAVINNPTAAGGTPTPGAFWEFYIGREDQAVKKFYWSTNSMDVAGKSGTPTPLLQQIADAAKQISAAPAPNWFHPIEGMDKIKKFLPPAR
jgi:hypothetical protein